MFISSFLLLLFFFSVLYEKRSIISCAGWLNCRILKEQNSCMIQLVRCGFKFGQCTTNATLAQLHISGTSQRVTARTQARLLAMVLVSQCDSVSESPATTRCFFFLEAQKCEGIAKKILLCSGAASRGVFEREQCEGGTKPASVEPCLRGSAAVQWLIRLINGQKVCNVARSGPALTSTGCYQSHLKNQSRNRQPTSVRMPQ